MELFKKVFAGVTIAALALSVAAPTGFANAATLTAGDLIKASGAAVYYYAADGKRYVFPTEATYKTWYSDYSMVKTLTDSELAGPFIGGNVVFRPGTYLVKITTDPRVYAVSPMGALHWVKSEAAAKTLWGNDWSKWVKDVPDQLFTNYTISTKDIDGTMHPAGSLIKYTGSDKVYFVAADGKKREFTGGSFAMNGFMSKFVLTSPDSITYPNGLAIAGKEDSLWDATQKAGGSVVVPPPVSTGGGLTVALAADTPAAADVPSGIGTASTRGARNIPFTKVNLTAGAKDVTLTKLSVKREGLSNDADIENVKLFDTNGNQLGTSQSLNADHKAMFSGFSYMVSAGQTKSLWIKADSDNSNADVDTGRIKFGIESASDVVSTASSVSGSFPIFGNLMTQVAIDIGQVTVSRGASDPSSTSVDIDQKDVRFMQVRLQAGSTEAVDINKIAIRKGDLGTISMSDLGNVYLHNDTTGKKVADAEVVGERFNFTFTPAHTLDKGKAVELSLRADVVNGSSKTITLALIEDSNWLIWTTGKQFGYDVALSPVPGTGVDFGSGTLPNAETESVTINRGTLVVSKGPNAPATADIPMGADDVKLASFLFDVRGEEVKVGSTALTATETSDFDISDGDATLFKLVDKDGKVWAGPVEASGVTVTFSTQMIFPVGKTELFLVGNITSAIGNNTAVGAALESGVDKILFGFTPSSALTSVKGMTSNKAITASPTVAVNNNTLTARSAALTVTMGLNPVEGSVVAGGVDVHLATTRLNPSAGGEDIKLTSLTFTEGVAAGGKTTTTTFGADFSNFKLWDKDGKQIGETEQPSSAADGATVTFNIDAGFVASKSAITELKITANPSSATIGTSETSMLMVSAFAGTGAKSGISLSTGTSGNSAQLTWLANAGLRVTLDGNNPIAQQASAGTNDLEVVRYKLRPLFEDVDVTELNLFAGDTAANPTSVADSVVSNLTSVKLYLNDKMVATTVFGADGKALVKMNAGEFRLIKDADSILKIKVDLSSKGALDSNTHMYLGLQDNETTNDGSDWAATASATTAYKVVANGVQSGITVPVAQIDASGLTGTSGAVAGGSKFELYDGILTVSLNANSSSGKLVQGTNQLLLIVDLKATGDEIAVKDIDVTSTGSCNIGNGGTPADGTVASGEGAAKWASLDETVTYWKWIKQSDASNDAVYLDTAATTSGLETDDALQRPTTTTNGTTGALKTTALSVGAGEVPKTIAFRADTGSVTACSSGQTLKVSIEANAGGTVTKGVEWADQEMDLDTTPSVVDSSDLTRNLPVNGNVLEI